MTFTIKDFLKKNNYVRKLRMEDKVKYTLVFGSVREMEMMGDGGDEKPALKIIVRDRSDNEVKAWSTSSLSTLDKLAELAPGDVFTVIKKSVKVGGRYIKGYDIEVIGKAESSEMPTEEETAQTEELPESAATKADKRWANEGEITTEEISEMMEEEPKQAK